MLRRSRAAREDSPTSHSLLLGASMSEKTGTTKKKSSRLTSREIAVPTLAMNQKRSIYTNVVSEP